MVVTIGVAMVVVGVVAGTRVVTTGAGATELVVVAAAIVVVDFFRPCFGWVVTVVPSAKVVLIGGKSPMVVTPVTVAVHSPGARSCRPASSATKAAPGRVIGTLIV